MDAFTVSAGFNYRSEKQLYANASIVSSSIVPGATLKLAYGKAKNSQNLLKDQKTVDITAEGLLKPFDQNLGKVEATCTIKF